MDLKRYGARINYKGDLVFLVDHARIANCEVLYKQVRSRSDTQTITILRQGVALNVGEILELLRLDGPVAYWLRRYTVVDIAQIFSLPREYFALPEKMD